MITQKLDFSLYFWAAATLDASVKNIPILTYVAALGLSVAAFQIAQGVTPLADNNPSSKKAAQASSFLPIHGLDSQITVPEDVTFTDVTAQSGIVQNNSSWGAA